MKIRHTTAMLSCFLSVYVWPTANATELRYPTLTRDGTVLQSACVPTELQRLKEQFARYKYKEDAKVWKAITIFLCGSKSQKNTRYIRNMMAEKLEYSSDYTGQDNQPQSMNASNELAANLFATGVAYDASIANLPDGMFSVLFTINEACGESRTFKYDRNKWLIVGAGAACD